MMSYCKQFYVCLYIWFFVLDRRYSVIHCTGYLKSWAPAKIGLEDHEAEGEGDACNLSCLVAVGRVLPTQVPAEAPRSHQHRPNIRPIQFISRHALDGKFLFIDQRYIQFQIIASNTFCFGSQ